MPHDLLTDFVACRGQMGLLMADRRMHIGLVDVSLPPYDDTWTLRYTLTVRHLDVSPRFAIPPLPGRFATCLKACNL